ncbi:MAG: PD40 domain-containing protein [Chloroflexi bacterium]|nr:PD40 domain-containing protein [Chloroflexota bacterium]
MLSVLLIVVAVLGGRGSSDSSVASLPPKSEINRIAFVGLDAHIHTVDPDGSHPRSISSGTGAFTWPTWSPDGRGLVFSGVAEDETGNLRTSLLAFDGASGDVTELFLGEPGVRGLLAEGVVHYPLWSPDSTRVAFIAFTSEGLSLFLDDVRDSAGPVFVMDQGPLWMSWSPDSQYLLVHRGADHFLVNTLEGIRVNDLGVRAVGYRVPAWKPQGGIITLARGVGPDRYTILNARVVGNGLDDPEPITFLREIGFPLAPAFLWSPSGELLALSGSTRPVMYLGQPLMVYRDLALFSDSPKAQTLLIQDNVIAYFWSPDGDRLAYVAPSRTASALRWVVVNAADGERWPLVDFVPSRDQLTMFRFFDQYAYSHSLWSPDSGSLVFAGRLVDDATAASAHYSLARQESHIIVVDTNPEPLTYIIADGTLGFWSPR